MSIVRLVLPALFIFASLSAQALPSQTLDVQAVRLAEDPKGPVMFVAYSELRAGETERYGSQIQPMEEGVADTLASLPENQMRTCDARFLRNGRFVYVYSLTNCR